MTRLGIRKDLSHSSSKTIEFILKKSEEYKTLPFDEYLKKYFKEFDAYDNEIWSKIISKLVQPAYDESRCHEMVYVYGYLDKKHHDFISQYEVYSKLKNDDRLTDDIRQFIGFLAGADEARQKGYKGLIVSGARGNKDYVNIIVFDQVDLTSILKSITPVKLK
ncbi:hypothetical protein [Flavobacterium psychrophilum]|uniref:hypothetical protein n=1 Tax=Flavobacterium psychrophilum TaxID=96345 RepID=UPI001C52FB2C|nr:hypothetical protein [Flavobacterium psychrophilum]